MYGFTEKEEAVFKRLDTPTKIQDFLNKIPINFEKKGETAMSPRSVLRENKAHCIEGAMFAAVALRYHGHKPLVVDLHSIKEDADHVIAVFCQNGYWGAISKSNHAVLRYREPVYRDVRELVMSCFHEYFLDNGKKTLRTYSMPVDLSRFDKKRWMTSEEDVWYIPNYLATVHHTQILSRTQIAHLRKADSVEIEAGKLTEWKKR
jgi:hypothetical protein